MILCYYFQALEARIQLLDQKIQASEQSNRMNESIRSQDTISRLLKLESTVRWVWGIRPWD